MKYPCDKPIKDPFEAKGECDKCTEHCPWFGCMVGRRPRFIMKGIADKLVKCDDIKYPANVVGIFKEH